MKWPNASLELKAITVAKIEQFYVVVTGRMTSFKGKTLQLLLLLFKKWRC